MSDDESIVLEEGPLNPSKAEDEDVIEVDLSIPPPSKRRVPRPHRKKYSPVVLNNS